MTNKRVIVDIVGGVANVWQIPSGVEVEVRDYDGSEDGAVEDEDKDGNRYLKTVYGRQP